MIPLLRKLDDDIQKILHKIDRISSEIYLIAIVEITGINNSSLSSEPNVLEQHISELSKYYESELEFLKQKLQPDDLKYGESKIEIPELMKQDELLRKERNQKLDFLKKYQSDAPASALIFPKENAGA